MQLMWRGSGFARGEGWRVRVMARCAAQARDVALFAVPVTAGSAMHSGFPIAIRGAVATAAQRRAVGEFQLPAIAGLQLLKVRFIVAIETMVVPVVPAVAHGEVLVRV